MFRDVKFHNTLTHAQMEERSKLVHAVSKHSRSLAVGYRFRNDEHVTHGENKAKLENMNAALGITSVMIIVTLKNVNGEHIYDVVEAPPFLHKECMMPLLIGHIVSVINDRHNSPSAFNEERPWSFWNIKMPRNKGIAREI